MLTASAFAFGFTDDLQVGPCAHNGAKVRSLRTLLFRDRIIGDAAFDGIANTFRRQWLAEVYLSALVYTALANQSSLQDAWVRLRGNDSTNDFIEVLQIVFQSIPITAYVHDHSGGHETDSELEETHQRLFHELSDLLHNQPVIDALHRHASTLWELPDAAWNDWLHAKFKTTLGAAVLDAVQQLCPESRRRGSDAGH